MECVPPGERHSVGEMSTAQDRRAEMTDWLSWKGEGEWGRPVVFCGDDVSLSKRHSAGVADTARSDFREDESMLSWIWKGGENLRLSCCCEEAGLWMCCWFGREVVRFNCVLKLSKTRFVVKCVAVKTTCRSCTWQVEGKQRTKYFEKAGHQRRVNSRHWIWMGHSVLKPRLHCFAFLCIDMSVEV
jgi:hypothetical protein